MRDLPSAVTTELVADAHSEVITLVEIGASTPVYRTNWSADVTFDSKAYVADDVRFGEIRSSTKQENPTMLLRLQNVRHPTTEAARPWSTLLAAEDLNGVDCAVRIVLASELSDADAQIYWAGWKVTGPEIDGDDVVLPLTAPHNIATLQTPEIPLIATRCGFEFKGKFCKAQTTATSCPGKNVAHCIGRHDQMALRFSQWPYHDYNLGGRF